VVNTTTTEINSICRYSDIFSDNLLGHSIIAFGII